MKCIGFLGYSNFAHMAKLLRSYVDRCRLSSKIDPLCHFPVSRKAFKIKEGANVPVYVPEFLLDQYCRSGTITRQKHTSGLMSGGAGMKREMKIFAIKTPKQHYGMFGILRLLVSDE